MGSGLILLIIVSAWLAVLVPMALRGYDSGASLRSADRFAGAMRALSRRDVRDVLAFRRRTLVVSKTRSAPEQGSAPHRLAGLFRLLKKPRPVDGRATAARRRRRTLLVLVALCLLTLALGLLRWPSVLAVHGVADVLLVLLLGRLRRQARSRRRRRQHAAPPGWTQARPARPVRVAGVPDRMPGRAAPLAMALVLPAVRYEDRPPATGTGSSWSPIPVPPPLYVGKAAAPVRAARVLDLTQPGRWSDAAAAGEAHEEMDQQELDEGLNRRRVVGGW